MPALSFTKIHHHLHLPPSQDVVRSLHRQHRAPPHVSWMNAGHCSPLADGGTEGGGTCPHSPPRQTARSLLLPPGWWCASCTSGRGRCTPHSPPGPGRSQGYYCSGPGERSGCQERNTILPPLPRPADQWPVLPGLWRSVTGGCHDHMHVCVCLCAHGQTTLTGVPSSAITHEPSAYSQAGRRAEGQGGGRREAERECGHISLLLPTPPEPAGPASARDPRYQACDTW